MKSTLIGAVVALALGACAMVDPVNYYDPARPGLYEGKVYTYDEAVRENCWVSMTALGGARLWACKGPEPHSG